MCYKPYSAEEDEVIRDLYGKMPAWAIGEKIGRTRTAVSKRAVNLGLGFRRKFVGRGGAISTRWSDEDVALLRRWYRRKSVPEVSKMLGRTRHQVVMKASKLGLRKRSPCYDGRVVLDKATDGSIRRVDIIKNGKKKSYAKHVWEKHNGPVPKGKKLMVRTGNPIDCRHVQNLELVSHRMVLFRNNPALTEDEAIAYDIIGDIRQKLKEI